ncbi:MAG: hypothetical protein R3236_11890, partial [Phycisphaeraceae bacterium]|nr:hypothetical protein [Phycisphaeraceae bacterium]
MNYLRSEATTTLQRHAATRMSMKSAKPNVRTRFLVPEFIATVGLGIVLFLFLVGVGAAQADTVTIRPDGVIASGAWTGVTAANLNDNSDATYASITGTLSSFTVSMANDAAYSGATINSVTVWTRGSVLSGGGQGESIIFGSSQPVLDTGGAATLPDDPTISSFSYNLAGITTSADIDALEIDVETDKLEAGEEARITDVWVVVNYTPSAAPNQITTCDGCHTQPPVEGASRDGLTG